MIWYVFVPSVRFKELQLMLDLRHPGSLLNPNVCLLLFINCTKVVQAVTLTRGEHLCWTMVSWQTGDVRLAELLFAWKAVASSPVWDSIVKCNYLTRGGNEEIFGRVSAVLTSAIRLTRRPSRRQIECLCCRPRRSPPSPEFTLSLSKGRRRETGQGGGGRGDQLLRRCARPGR